MGEQVLSRESLTRRGQVFPMWTRLQNPMTRALLSRESLLTLFALALLIVERHYRDFGLMAPQYWIFEWHLSTVVALFAIPVLVLMLTGASPQAFGMRWGHARVWGPYLAVFLVVMVPVVLIASRMDSVQRYYPQCGQVSVEPGLWPILILSYGVYFLAWEFFFRGFLLFGLARRLGAYSIVLQTIPFCLMHLGKPKPEVWASVIAGLALGMMAYRGKSVLPCVFIHWLCAVGLELLTVLWRTAPM